MAERISTGGNERRRLRREASRLAVCSGVEGPRSDPIWMERGLRGGHWPSWHARGQSWEHLECHAQECVYSCRHRGEPHGKRVNSVQNGHGAGGCPSRREEGKARASSGVVSPGGEEGTCRRDREGVESKVVCGCTEAGCKDSSGGRALSELAVGTHFAGRNGSVEEGSLQTSSRGWVASPSACSVHLSLADPTPCLTVPCV